MIMIIETTTVSIEMYVLIKETAGVSDKYRTRYSNCLVLLASGSAHLHKTISYIDI